MSEPVSAKAPECIETARLRLRRPRTDDAEALFESYAASEAVCRYVGWPRHTTLDDTRQFLAFSDGQWDRWPAGPFVIVDPKTSVVMGSTGLAFESPAVASTGYVLAERFWGSGYASEALTAMVALAESTGVERLYALCHPQHRPSRRVLEKCGFALEPSGVATVFPNLDGGPTAMAACYARALAGEGSRDAPAAPSESD